MASGGRAMAASIPFAPVGTPSTSWPRADTSVSIIARMASESSMTRIRIVGL